MNIAIMNAWQRMNEWRRAHPLSFLFRALILVGMTIVFIVQRIFWTPDILFLILLGLFLIFGQVRAFATRLGPFVVLLLIYEAFRSVADELNTRVHYQVMIDVDRFMFGGHLPTAWLQQWLWHGHLHWYDFYFYFLYTVHFLVPIGLAVLIWKVRDKLYWQYVTAFVLLSFAAFVTYLAFPAAPPWLASNAGRGEQIHRISSDVWFAMGVKNSSEFYTNLSPNQVAAVPSLHAAYPLLAVLFIAKLFTWRRVWWLMLYPASIWLGVVYLGEHYVIDVELGIVYALVAYWLTDRLFALRDHYGKFRKVIPGLIADLSRRKKQSQS